MAKPIKPLNHACFEASAADILARVYEAFPAPLRIEFSEFHEAAMAAGKMPPHCPARFESWDSLYGSTLGFLEREGLVHVEEWRTLDAQGVVLTSKGFIVLNRPLDFMANADSTPTLGQRLMQSAGQEAITSTIGTIIGLLVKNSIP